MAPPPPGLDSRGRVCYTRCRKRDRRTDRRKGGARMIEVAIVEDDDRERERLLGFLKRYAEESQQPFAFSIFTNAFDFLEEKKIFDIAFLDIMMPNMTGMEAAERLRRSNQRTVIIFVTTMVQFAIKSYEVDALDYVVKPVSFERLTMKLSKAIQVIAANEGGTVVINDAQGMVKQSTQDIYYVEVSGHKLSYHTVNGVYTELGSLSDLEKVLSTYDFMRCNACYLVNPRHIRQIKSKELLVLLSNGETLKISQTKRKSFISELTNWMGQGKC